MANYRETVPVWVDLAEATQAWENEYGVDLSMDLRTCTTRGRADLYAEIKAFDRLEGADRPIHAVRQPLAIRRLGAPIKNLLYGVFTCLEQIETTPWLWPHKLRRERVQAD